MKLLRPLALAVVALAMLSPFFSTGAGEKKKVPSPVELTDKASDTWLLKKMEIGAKVLSDRDYVFTALPEEIEGGHYVLRNSGDWQSWVPPGAVKADKNLTVYLILNTHQMKKELVTEVHFNQLSKEGWKAVKEEVEGTFNAGEGWKWKAVKKDYKKGDLIIHLKTVRLECPVIFVFK